MVGEIFIKLIILHCFNSLFIFTDEDEIYNNPNLHSEEQDELEIPDGWYFQNRFSKRNYLTFFTFAYFRINFINDLHTAKRSTRPHLKHRTQANLTKFKNNI